MQLIEIKLKQKDRLLECWFDNGEHFQLCCEHLRVHSPSAEVQGHGGQGGVTPTDKARVNIIGLEPVGHYAIRLIFDDQHQSGLYTWDYLYELAKRFGTSV